MSKEILLRILRQQRDLARLVSQQQDDLDTYVVKRRDCCTAHNHDMREVINALQSLGSCMKEADATMTMCSEAKGSKDSSSNDEDSKEAKSSVGGAIGIDTDSTKGHTEDRIGQDLLVQPTSPTCLTLWPPRHYKPRGLLRRQFTFTCYINVVMQALAAVDPFKLEDQLGQDVVGQELRMRRTTMNEPGQYKTIIMLTARLQLNLGWEFLNLLKQLRDNNEDPVHPYALQFTLAKELLRPGQFMSQTYKFDGRREEDAEEFYAKLLNRLWARWGYTDTLSRLLRVGTSDVFTCNTTGIERTLPSVEDWKLMLYPPDHLSTTVAEAVNQGAGVPLRSVLDLLQHNSTNHIGELPEGFENASTDKTWHFRKLPEFLMLQFHRHEMSEDKTLKTHANPSRPKLAYRVEFDDNDYTIDLSAMDAHAKELGSVYKLRTVIYHHGNTFASGHYFAITRTERYGLDTWYECNDDNISESLNGPYPISGVEYAQAYLAMYEKIRHNDTAKEMRDIKEIRGQETQIIRSKGEEEALPELITEYHW